MCSPKHGRPNTDVLYLVYQETQKSQKRSSAVSKIGFTVPINSYIYFQMFHTAIVWLQFQIQPTLPFSNNLEQKCQHETRMAPMKRW